MANYKIDIGGKPINVGGATAAGAAAAGPGGALAGLAYDNRGNVKKELSNIGSQVDKLNPFKGPEVQQVAGPDPNALRMVTESGRFEDAGFNTTAVDTGWADDARRHQAMVGSQLRDQALGQGPSIAAQQMRAGQEAAMAQSRAALASSRGGANPLAARAAIQANQAGQLDIAQKAGIARLQEQQMAAQNFGALANQMRTGDLQTVELKAKQQNDFNQLRQQYMNAGIDAQRANQMAALDFERLKQGAEQANIAAKNAAAAGNKQFVRQIVAGGAEAGMKAATAGAA